MARTSLPMSCSDSLSISSKSRQMMFAFGEPSAGQLVNQEAATPDTECQHKNQTCTAATGFSASGCSSANRGSNSLILSTSSSDCSLPNGSKSGVWKYRCYKKSAHCAGHIHNFKSGGTFGKFNTNFLTSQFFKGPKTNYAVLQH